MNNSFFLGNLSQIYLFNQINNKSDQSDKNYQRVFSLTTDMFRDQTLISQKIMTDIVTKQAKNIMKTESRLTSEEKSQQKWVKKR